MRTIQNSLFLESFRCTSRSAMSTARGSLLLLPPLLTGDSRTSCTFFNGLSIPVHEYSSTCVSFTVTIIKPCYNDIKSVSGKGGSVEQRRNRSGTIIRTDLYGTYGNITPIPCIVKEQTDFQNTRFPLGLSKEPLQTALESGCSLLARDVGFVALRLLYTLRSSGSVFRRSYRNQIGILEIRPGSRIPSVAI